MGDARRFEVFARFIRRTFPAATSVADVAGGHGELAFWLGELGLRPVVIDPRPVTFPRWIHRRLRKRAVCGGRRIGIERIERVVARVEDADLRRFDLVVALHPDEATEPVVRAAVAHGADFAVVPCCVFPLDGIRRSRAGWLTHLASLAPGARVSALPIGGANVVLWWRARTAETDETEAADVTEADPIRDILWHWRDTVGDAPAREPLHNTGTILGITAPAGERFVLKEVAKGQPVAERLARLAAEYRVLRHLAAHGVPVAVPVPTDAGRLFVQDGAAVYTLSPRLPVGGRDPAPGPAPWPDPSPERRAENLGAAIGRLHRALAAYVGDLRSWRMDLAPEVLDVALPRLRAHLDGARAAALEAALAPLAAPLRAALTGLPEQPIHGDCHGGNILVAGGEVTGFVDLDHLPVGPKVYDLAYLLADQIKWRLDDPVYVARWLAGLPHLLAGYAREHPLSGRERQAIWFGMLATQLIFAEGAIKKGKEANVALNLDAFWWMHRHRDEIEQRVRRP
jgi:Ser/Thr protein kinase RdoA (MazF antagonist)